MKKLVIFLVVIIGIFATIAGLTVKQQKEKSEGNMFQKDKLDPATINQLDDPLYQNIILPDVLKERLANKEDVTVYFYSPKCDYCVETTPVVSPVAKDLNIDLVQFNLLEFQEGFQEFAVEFTPTIIHYKNGKEHERIVGAHTEEEFEDWFNEYVK